MIGLEQTSVGYSIAAGLIQKMEEDGTIAVESSGSNIREVKLLVIDDEAVNQVKKSDEPALAPTDESLTTKADKMSSVKEADRVAGEELVATPAEQRKLELLNLAWVILQDASDPDGNVMGATAPVIEQGLKGQGIIVTESTANQLNWLLGKLDRRILRGPRKKAVQEISQSGREISLQELRSVMLATARPKVVKDKKTEPLVKAEQSASVELKAAKAPEVPKANRVQLTTTGNRPLQEVLADIIEDLRKQLREKDETIGSLQKRLREGGEAAQQIIKNLNKDLDTANDEKRELKEQLMQTNTPTPRVEKLLAELSKTTTS